MDIFGTSNSNLNDEAQEHLDRAAAEEDEAARILRQQADTLNRQADAAEEGRLGGEADTGWNPFG